ncbi:MAG: septum formation initiator family protein [Blastochloris viridis]|uniref:Septum formation initiator family protein n=1 Tax=Blastochloris viridis TaxID=1079 RepID=A0A6N4RC52_BLAVI|nr:MAG: septum formation initiator family protein [Blastochloris viridis]
MVTIVVGKWKQRLKPLVLPGLVGLLLLYTADQLLTGERGIVTWRVMKTQITDLQTQVYDLKYDIHRLENHIARLRGIKNPDGTIARPDPDFIDELVRRELGYLKPNDRVILVKEIKKLP